ncbi:MAG: hypothetical protein PHZ00_03925 [Candidatus Peribacteraceae bacterium]|nr:hypothetical protein [Candidatus Peribacteraceae bacterium]
MAETSDALPIKLTTNLCIDEQTEGINCPRLDATNTEKYEPIIAHPTTEARSGLQVLTVTPCKHSNIDSKGGYDKVSCQIKPAGEKCKVQDGSLVEEKDGRSPHIVTGSRQGLAVTVDLRPTKK